MTVGHDAAVALITAARDEAVAAAGGKPDRHAPKPHVTVARPPRRCTADERRHIVAWAEAKPAIDAAVAIDRLALYTWSDNRGRPRQFRLVATHELPP